MLRVTISDIALLRAFSQIMQTFPTPPIERALGLKLVSGNTAKHPLHGFTPDATRLRRSSRDVVGGLCFGAGLRIFARAHGLQFECNKPSALAQKA
jgi:hypothetical protein